MNGDMMDCPEVGDRIKVVVAPHQPGHAEGIVRQCINGALGIEFDATPGEVYHWYVPAEVMVTVPAPDPEPPMPGQNSLRERAAPRAGERILRERTAERFGELEPATRTMKFIASDESVDRYGDIIRVSGWQLDNYRKNPVLLFGHNSREPPIGKVRNIGVVGTQLLAEAEFLPAGAYDLADTVWACLEAGALRATSVGFAPTGKINQLIDEKGNWTGYEFTSQELLELSVVPVPANPQALALAKSLGIRAELARSLFLDCQPRASARAALEQRRRSIRILELGRTP